MVDFTMDESSLIERIKTPALKESLELARSAVERIWPRDVDRVITYYTDHGPAHLARVAAWARQLLSANIGHDWSETELYLLLLGIYFHDVGMQCDPRRHAGVVDLAIRCCGAPWSLQEFTYASGPLTRDEQKRIRSNHHLLSVAWIYWAREHDDPLLGDAARSIPEELVEDVALVSKFHTSLPIRDCPPSSDTLPDTRTGMVAALLRLSDELDITASRVSDVEVVRQFALDPKNEVYWWLHSRTDVTMGSDNLLVVTFKLNPVDMELAEAVEKGFLDQFREKNRDCMSVLAEHLISIAVSPDSRVIEAPEALELPRSIAAEIQALTQGKSGSTSGRLPTRVFDPKLIRRLYLELEDSRTGSELVGILGLLDGLEAGSLRGHDGIEGVRAQTLNALQRKTPEDVSAISDALLGHVLPRCLYRDSSEHEDGRYIGHLYRERMGRWLRIHPTQLAECREALLRLLSIALLSPSCEQSCLAIASIGVRHQWVTDALWRVANSGTDHEVDTALNCIVHLGVPDEGRGPTAHALIQGLMAGRVSTTLWSALQELHDPITINAVRQAWLLKGVESPPSQAKNALRLLARIAATHPDESEVQERTWKTVRDYVVGFPNYLDAHLLLDSTIAPAFNTDDVVFHLVSKMNGEFDSLEVGRHHRYLLCHRLLDCVRPQQVRAWRVLGSEQSDSLQVLLQDTCADSGVASTSQTELGLLKQVAWQILLCGGSQDLLSHDYFESCILAETSPYLHADALEWLKCFRIDPLPPSAVRLVTETYDEARDTFPPQYPDRTGAIRLLQSAASWGAFDALKQFGYTYMGHVLQESVVALAAVALHLCPDDQDRVLGDLLEIALNAGEVRWRTSAIGALYLLGELQSLKGLDSDALIRVGCDEKLPLHDRLQTIRTIGFLPSAEVSESSAAQLADWAESSNDEEIRWATLEAMARIGQLGKRTDLFTTVLGLEQIDGKWRVANVAQLGDPVVLIICLLYDHDVDAFAPAVAALLTDCNMQTLSTVVHAVRVIHGADRRQDIPEVVRDALLARLTRGGSFWVSVQDLINTAAEVIPDDVVNVLDNTASEHWGVDDFQALAEALGRAPYICEESRQHAVKQLLELTRNAHYSVRRSAYRSIHLLDEALHTQICTVWASSRELGLRQRAAEASVWLGPDDDADSDWPSGLRPLSRDPEPTVREAAERAREEWLRIAWSSAYLDEILSLDGGSNDDILSGWGCGSALSKTGNDDSLRRIEEHLDQQNLAPHVRAWLEHIHKQISKQWSETVKKWPDSIDEWNGVWEESA